MRYRTLGLLLLGGLLAAPMPRAVAQQPAPKRQFGNVDAISAAQLKDYLYFIASDEMEGRYTPSRGLDTTAKFLALNLSRWGLKPAGDDGTFFQRIALRRSEIDTAGSSAAINGRACRPDTDFRPAGSGFGPPAGGKASGSVAYVGNGWAVKAKNLDSYAGIDVKGKVLVVLNATGLPKDVTQDDLKGKQGEDWDNAASYAQRSGAAGLIYVPSFDTIANWERAGQISRRQRDSTVVERLSGAGPAAVPAITASASMLNDLFAGEKQRGAQIFARGMNVDPGESFELDAKKQVSFHIAVKNEQMTTQNVVAVLEGRDPVLKNEYVAMGAHYDHIGTQPVTGGADGIFNGADDDGSGTTAILAMAEAFAKGPRPKRSLLFVWHCGEERGLWGSRYFTEFPTIPLNQVVAQLNIDMIGRSKKDGDTNPRNKDLSGPNDIYVIGSKMMSSDLGAVSEAVNGSYLNVKFDYRYDDQKDPNRFFFRSDHVNYARKGVPIIFYFDGVHEDYHRPGDSADKIDYQKMEKVTRTVFATAWTLAESASRPKVDKQLPTELRGR